MYLESGPDITFRDRLLKTVKTTKFKIFLKLLLLVAQSILLFCQIKYDLDILCVPNVLLCIIQIFIKA